MTAMTPEQQTRLHDALTGLAEASTDVDEIFAMQTNLATAMLRNAAAVAREEVSARTASDMEFALNDLRLIADELPDDDRARFEPHLTAIAKIIEELKGAAALPARLVSQIEQLKGKLSERSKAIQRAPYQAPEAAKAPLPHEPAVLRPEAREIRMLLRNAGFDTPALDRLVDGNDELYLSDVNRVIEELEVILS